MARRGENIYKRKDGRWEGRYRIWVSDKSVYRSVYGKTYHEVKEKLIMKKQEPALKQERRPHFSQGLTIGEAAVNWLEENRIKWKESTYATYRSITEKHIIASAGHRMAVNFTEEDYRNFFTNLGRGKKKANYSFAYLNQIHVIFVQIFQFLNKKYHCGMTEYPCPLSIRQQKAAMVPEGENLKKLEKYLFGRASERDATSIGILLSGCCGLRIGELCALRWENISFERGTLRVTETMQRIRTFKKGGERTKVIVTEPKSRTSCREIPLPDYLLAYLMKLGGKRNGFLLSGKKKEYLEPRTLQYRFKRILQELRIPYFNFHMLRHVFATNCIAGGFDMKTLSELLGHANVTTTMKIYVHSDMERKKQLMAGYRMAI